MEPEEAAERLLLRPSASNCWRRCGLGDQSSTEPLEEKALLARCSDRRTVIHGGGKIWDALDHQDGARLARLAQSAKALDQPPGRW